MATKLLPAHFAALLPGVIGLICRCGTDDWAVVSIKSRPSPAGYVRLRCKECAREASAPAVKLSSRVVAKRAAYYYARTSASYELQLSRWLGVLAACISSGEFKDVQRLQHIQSLINQALAFPVDITTPEVRTHELVTAVVLARGIFLNTTRETYTGPLPWQDVVASAYYMLATARYFQPCVDEISYEGVWDPSTKRLRPFQTPSWMPTPATFTTHAH